MHILYEYTIVNNLTVCQPAPFCKCTILHTKCIVKKKMLGGLLLFQVFFGSTTRTPHCGGFADIV